MKLSEQESLFLKSSTTKRDDTNASDLRQLARNQRTQRSSEVSFFHVGRLVHENFSRLVL